MIDQLITLANTYSKREIFPVLRKPLSALFVIGISSFIFEKFYFKYELIPLNDYETYYRFFVNGDFIIPSGIFFVIWNVTSWLSFILFKLPNFFIGQRLRRAIIEFSFSKTISPNQMEAVAKVVTQSNNDPLIRAFESIKSKMSSFDLKKININIERIQTNLEEEFKILVRCSIAIPIYLFNVPHFGWLLACLIYGIILIAGSLLYIGYQLGEILPVVLSKASSEIDSYLAQKDSFDNGG